MTDKQTIRKICSVAAIILCSVMILAGCGTSSDTASDMADSPYDGEDSAADVSGSMNSSDYDDDYDYAADGSYSEDESYGISGSDDVSDDAASDEPADSSSDSGNSDGVPPDIKDSTDNPPVINTDMLIYTCNMEIDTLDYETSLSTFRSMLSQAGGFIENENYSDGQPSGMYYMEESGKNKNYHATVRIPHDKYDEFLNGASSLGDIRSRTSNVENVSQEYNDLNTSLEIYRAKEKRYIKMLSEITDDSYAISVEHELTEIQIKIAELKTRMNTIRTDVAYSTINISIHQVSKYKEEPAKTDTFGQRMTNTFKKTWSTFLAFLEIMLFLFIILLPYLALALIILVVIHFILVKKGKKGLFFRHRK